MRLTRSVPSALDALYALNARNEAQAIDAAVDFIDSALEAHNVWWCGALLAQTAVDALRDDVMLALLIATLPARQPLREARTRYADKVRAALRARQWPEEDIHAAIDDLI